MRHLIFVLVACACLVAGCGEVDFVVDAGPAPDGGLPVGDGGPMFMGDAGPTVVDSGVPGMEDAWVTPGEDASAPTDDAATGSDAGSVVSPTCGNAVIDPGEICDPGHLVHDDAGVHAESSSADRTMCPDCHSIVCPTAPGSSRLAGLVSGTGTAADNRCVYVAPTLPGTPYRRLSWSSTAERNAYFGALRTLGTPVSGSVPVSRHAIAPALSCSGSGGTGSPLSAGCVMQQPGSMCVASGGVGRCMAWYWTAGADVGMPVTDMPTSSDASPQSADQYAQVTITAASATYSQQAFDGASGYFFVLDPPPYL